MTDPNKKTGFSTIEELKAQYPGMSFVTAQESPLSKLDQFALHAPAEMFGRPSPWGEWQTVDRITYDVRIRYQWAHAMLKESKKQNEILTKID